MIETIKNELKSYLESVLSARYGKPVGVVVEEPKRKDQGDLSVPVFTIAKTAQTGVPAVQKDIADAIAASPLHAYFSQIAPMGGFLNLRLDPAGIAKAIMKAFLAQGEAYGDSLKNAGETVVIDYSSPNIAKPFSIGHLRSTIIGHALGNLLEKTGAKVVRINHLGDFGTQFGKIIYAFQTFGDRSKVEADPINELVKLYVEYHERAKEHPELDDAARAIFTALEHGDPIYTALWSWFREVSLADYMQVYQLLDVHFDSYNGEAFYNDKMQAVIDELAAKNLLKEDAGAMIVDLGEEIPPALIQKKDGSTLYITRDLAALFYRKNTYHFDRALYVVGNEQKLHFEQLKKVVRLMGYPEADTIEHVNFGLVLQDGKKMSTRKGKVVKLVDVLHEAIELSKAYIEEKNPDLADKDAIATKIGVSAIIFNDLKNFRANDFEFNLEDMVKFEGQTGPYLQYTSVRITSILNLEPFVFDGDVDFALLAADPAFEIVKAVGQYQSTVEKAAAEASPSIVAKYLLSLAALFNSYYAKERVNVEDVREKQTKKHLIAMVRAVLNDGMRLLGMQIIEKM
ncbi:MAG TPA: arginine--tRNA ligase [Acholeplasmatales bacterium]|nr:MAG: arginine--tRNA ligase [Tenericutes bacterium GWF2_57_13]HAQ57273.1 arginine--tRNA ligase [Acholeplasmatales bacterium]